MKLNLNQIVQDIDGTPANYSRGPLPDGTPQPPIPLTFKLLIMHALNGPCAENEKMPRYLLMRAMIAAGEEGVVELTEGQPEVIRKACAASTPPFLYGQVCAALGLA